MTPLNPISHYGQNLIFLISQPRAGSTLLQRILAGHSAIHTTAEPWLMLHPIYALREEGHTAEYNAVLAHTALRDFLNTLNGENERYVVALRQMAVHLYNTACDGVGKSHFLDKTPRYYHIIPELASIFPEAKFILLLRNPLAVLNSFLNTHVEGHWVLLARYKHDLLTAPQKLMEGISILGERATTVRYEALVGDPQTHVRAVCEHLDVSFHLEMLTYGIRTVPEGRMGDDTKIWEYTRPTTDSLDRWMELAHHRQTHHFAQSYLQALGPDLLSQLGYPYSELVAPLEAVPPSKGQIEFTWEQLFDPDEALQKRLTLIELALLEHRRIVHGMKRFLRRLRR